MYLREKDKHFKLIVVSRAYPKSDLEEDRDWLSVKIEVQDNGNNWSTNGVFLRKSEVEKIIDKLAFVQLDQNESQERIDFIEHEVAFTLSKKRIIVHLDFDAHPKGKNYDYQNDREYSISFNNSPEISDQLKQDIANI